MDENAARQVLLVRAAEANDAADALLSEDDRRYAGRAAAELVRWRATERGQRASADAFVAKRAELLAAKLTERSPRTGRALAAMRWRPWIGIALPAIAFVSGLVAEHIADPGRINILAFPLLGIIVWNLIVYVGLLLRTVKKMAARSRQRPGWIARLVAGAQRNVSARITGPLASALASFSLDWGERSAPLVSARAARILHLSAAALALGAVCGLFLRGLVYEYRAGWESTFIDAPFVHGLLTLFLAPAAHLIGQPFPTLEEVTALRWGATGDAGGENAARWIYFYAVAVGVTVIVPRLVLAAIAGMRESWLSRRFPVSLEDAYFRRLLSGWREAPALVEVVPYAYTPNEEAIRGVQRLANGLFGDDVEVHWSERVAFGEEDALGARASASPARANGIDARTMAPEARPLASDPSAASLPSGQGAAGRVERAGGGATRPPDLVIALFNLASTPEPENHGVFLERMRARTRGAMTMVIDEGPYRSRLGAQAGTEARIAERRQAWSGLAQTRGVRPIFVDLSLPQLAAAQRELDALVAGRTTPA